jgi:O-antigen/teichoic acid export membrane protein
VTEVRAEETLEEEEARVEEPHPRLGVAALARDTAIYGGTRVLLKSLTFLLVPLYAQFLSPRDFGVLEIVLATVGLVDVVISANLDGVLSRFYFDRDEAAWRRQVITVYLLISALYPAVVVGTLVAFSGELSDLLLGGAGSAVLFVIALCDLYLTNVVDLPLLLARLRRKPFTFAAYSLTRGVVQVTLAVLLVAVLELGVEGILLASLLSVCVAFVVTLREYVGDIARSFSGRLAGEMVSFAWPGIIGGLSFYAINLVDRFLVEHFHGLADTGLLGVAFRYSQIVLVAVLAFRMGWPQWHYSWLRSDRHPQVVARGANLYFFAVGFLAVAVSAWILPLFHLIMPARFHEATSAVAPLALAAIGTGAYSIFAVGFMVTKRMRIVTALVVVTAVGVVALKLVLVPAFSFEGAAWGTAAGFAFLALLVVAVAQRVYPVPWDVRRIGLAVGLAAALALASLAVDAWMPLAASLPVRVAIVAAFPLVLLALGFFPRSDLEAARARLSALRGGGRRRGGSS